MATNPPELGKLLDGLIYAVPRDAIHIAIAPVIAKMKLHPGQGIGFVDDTKHNVGLVPNPIGIVDPFIQHPIYPGDMFYMFLYPNTITSLRHDWTHPAFNDNPCAAVPIKATPYVEILTQLKNRPELKVETEPTAAYTNQDDGSKYMTAKKWLEDFAADLEMTYEDLIDAAIAHQHNGYWHTLGFDTPDRCWHDMPTFWEHFQTVTGREVEDESANFFSCAC